jgi:aminopeptidase N
MMEALANYSAMLLLERKKGARAVDAVLEKYREHLMEKRANGASIESAGPIHLGVRLDTSETPDSYRTIVYEKGTWIMHMLRRRLGDAAFFDVLREIHTRFLRGRVTAADLRTLAAQRQAKDAPDPKLEQFFASYVESAGIPVLRLQVGPRRGATVRLELEQSGVGEDFSVDVPIEIDYGRGKTEVRWLRTDGAKTSAEWSLSAAPVRVALDPRNWLLAVKK